MQQHYLGGILQLHQQRVKKVGLSLIILSCPWLRPDKNDLLMFSVVDFEVIGDARFIIPEVDSFLDSRVLDNLCWPSPLFLDFL